MELLLCLGLFFLLEILSSWILSSLLFHIVTWLLPNVWVLVIYHSFASYYNVFNQYYFLNYSYKDYTTQYLKQFCDCDRANSMSILQKTTLQG